jgi:hypothetical protein
VVLLERVEVLALQVQAEVRVLLVLGLQGQAGVAALPVPVVLLVLREVPVPRARVGVPAVVEAVVPPERTEATERQEPLEWTELMAVPEVLARMGRTERPVLLEALEALEQPDRTV